VPIATAFGSSGNKFLHCPISKGIRAINMVISRQTSVRKGLFTLAVDLVLKLLQG
jgi:hypothetical protein